MTPLSTTAARLTKASSSPEVRPGFYWLTGPVSDFRDHEVEGIAGTDIDQLDPMSLAEASFAGVTLLHGFVCRRTSEEINWPVMLCALILDTDGHFGQVDIEVLTSEPPWRRVLLHRLLRECVAELMEEPRFRQPPLTDAWQRCILANHVFGVARQGAAIVNDLRNPGEPVLRQVEDLWKRGSQPTNLRRPSTEASEML